MGNIIFERIKNCSYLVATVLSIVLSTTTVSGQTDLTNIVPPSPSTQQFQRYIEYPVGNFTGVPDINIPLYTITEGDLTVPISISYNASGCKPSAPNGFVGMNWTLNSGGKISRTIVDFPDDHFAQPPNPFYTTDQLNAYLPSSYYQRDEILYNWETEADKEPDRFYYSFSNYSGGFVLKRDALRTPLLLPYKPIQISPHKNSISGQIDYFNVVDDRGNKYRFDESEAVTTGNFLATSAWDISQMISADDPTDTITFSQGTAPREEAATNRVDFFVTDETPWDANGVIRDCYGGAANQPPAAYTKSYQDVLSNYGPSWSTATDLVYGCSVPYQISFKEGYVRFIPDPTTKMLQQIEVFDKENNLIKTIGFLYKNVPDSRYLLKEIDFYDSQHNFISNYKFAYYDENAGLSNAYSCGVDYWDYYNGQTLSPTLNGGLLPNWTVYYNQTLSRQPVQIGYNNRISNEDAMKTLILDSITYPTGGITTYDYEANEYSGTIPNYSGGHIVGGLRVKTIAKYKSAGATPEVKTYEYSNEYMDFYPGDIDDYSYSLQGFIPDFVGGQYSQGWNPYRERWYSSEPNFNIAPHGSPVVYTTVTVYNGDGTNNTGKTVYSYDYTPVSDTTYNTNGSVDVQGYSIMPKHYLNPFQNWTSGNLISVNTYQNNNGTYIPVSQQYYTYQNILGDTLRGFKLDRYAVFTYDGCSSYPFADWNNYNLDLYVYAQGLTSAYNYGDYYIIAGDRRLIRMDETMYNSQGVTSVTKTTTYEYDNPVNDLPTQKTTTTSAGNTLITQYKYPADFSNQVPYNIMVNNLHIWSPVIEQLEYKNNTSNFLNSVRTNYSEFNGDSAQVYPSSVDIRSGTGNYESHIQYNAYDTHGNILEQRKVDNPKEVYIWGYAHQYPVAKIIGSDYNTAIGFVDTAKLNNAEDYPDLQIRTELNKIRTGLGGTNALVTTYTYAPLIGMTSSTDPSGHTIYYEYDGLGRLTLVRDNNNNVIKRYCYNYAGQQTENCAVVNYGFLYKNTAVSTTLNRNNCGTGYDGDTITYTVPAGKYTSSISQADADQQAQNDITANAQNYANANGTCTSSAQVGVFFDDETNNPYNSNIIYQITFTPTTGNPITYTYPENESSVQVPPGQYLVTISVDGEVYDNSYNPDGYGSVHCQGDGNAFSQCESFGNDSNFNDYSFNVDLGTSTSWTVQLNQSSCQ